MYFPELWSELTRPEPLLRAAYLVFGPEEYLCRKAFERIRELCGEVRPLDYGELLGSEASLADVGEEISTLPMIARRRLVVVRQAEKLLGKAQRGGKLTREAEYLRKVLSAGGDTWCLVLIASPSVTLPSMPGGGLLKALSCFGCYPLPDRQLGPWVQREAKGRGLRIDGKAVARLVALTGTSLLDLEQELDKLVAYAGADGEVTRATVDEVADASAGSLPDLLDAAAAGDVPRALAALDSVLLLPRNAMRVLPSLAAMLEDILLAVTLPREGLAEAFPPWRLKEVLAKAQGWSAARVLQALDDLFAAELTSKSGAARPEAALTRFLISLDPEGTASRAGGMLSRR
jgi:DNA polymerase-3 subunit delta